MAILPGLWVIFLAALLAGALRRWFDPVPRRCWLVWGLAMAPVFGAALFGGRVLLPLGYLTRVPPFSGLVEGSPPGNLLQSDLVLQITPWMVRVREAYLAGEWPLWNPLAGAGEPLLANPQSQAFQPLVWLALPFPVAAGVGIVAALRMLLPLVFSFLLFRRQGLSEAVSLGASLMLGLSGFLQLFLGWPLAGSATFLPVLLYALVMTDQRGARRDRLLLALAVAALLLVGHPETGLHVLVLAGVWGISLLRARPAGQRLALAGSWAVAGAVGCALAAPVVLPAAAYLPQSVRAALLEARRDRLAAEIPADEAPAPGARERGIVPRLLPVAAPNAFGNNRFGAYWGERNVNEDAAGFTGTAALLAFFLALLPVGGRRFPQEKLALGIALAALAVLARPPGLPELLDALPVLRQSLSFHSRIALLFNFCAAYAAGCVWERWRRGEAQPRKVVSLALLLAGVITWGYLAHSRPELANLRHGTLALQLGTLAAAAFLLSRARGSLSALLLVGTVELLAIHGPANPTAPAALFYPQTPSIAFLEERLDPWYRVAGLGPALRPNFASVYGLADPRSSNPIKPAPYVEAIRRINRFPGRPTDGFTSPGDPLYGLLGVRFVMTAPRMRLPRPLRLVDRRPGAWIYRRPGALPRLFLPASTVPCCLEKIGDFAETAVVRPEAAWSATEPQASSLTLGALEPAWMQARAFLAEPRLLTGSVYQDGGWKLLVNGERRPTILANGPFVAAWLPAGEASVDLLYRPSGFFLGMFLAALGLAAGAAFWVPPPQTASRSQARIELSE
ncbi:MAG TPA: hypothetical protein VJ725_28625 [Thermoanaerobaculia bacterium]|nr:hypothetical protein [Thermoanaerobaculia bacterium]